MELLSALLVLAAVALSFGISSAAGFGGSLLLVPTLALVVGPKEGVALAALLLAANNVVKVGVYRDSLPVRASVWLVLATSAGALAGAALFVHISDEAAMIAVLLGIAVAAVADRRVLRSSRVPAPALAAASGATSGVSGTSGPLKGLAIRSLMLDRRHYVGAASLVSFAGDATKAGVFAHGSLLGGDAAWLCAASVPLMVIATFAGSRVNATIGERGFTILFWSVMSGYSARLLLVLT